MEKSLNGKKLLSLTKGLAGFAGILLVLFVIFSCNNILITSGGSLIISTPGARAASDSISYTIVVEGSQGSPQSKPLTSGTTVQFDNLAPDTYTISVEGKNKDGVLVFSGTKSATVTAGETSSVMVELEKLVGSLTVNFEGADDSTDTSFTFELTDLEGNTISDGSSSQFDNLAPGTYNVVVKGTQNNVLVFYGTSSATVEAGKTESADVELKKGASDFASLESAIAAGGTVYIFENIDVEKTLSISTDVSVTILPAYQDVTLKNTGSVDMFNVSAGNLTIGGGEHTITLDGNTLSNHAINIKSIGEVTLSSNAVIMNCGTASVKLQNTNYNSTLALFFLEGGTIKDNNGSGVEVLDAGKFTMNSGYIKDNNTSNGGGVNLNGGYFYLNGGSITGNNANGTETDTSTGTGGGVYINSGTLYMNGGSITGNTSTRNGGGVYAFKTFIMTGGLIEGNSTSGSGNGVYYGGDREFEMSGSAVIAPDNDVYVSSSKTITITGELTGDSPVATITPYTYPDASTQVQVLSLGNFTSAASKFAVTPNPDDGTQWFINTEGKLQEGACVSDFASLENAISAGGTVYITKAITMERTLDINREVTLLSTTQSVVLTGLNPGNLFTVSTGGKLTIGDADHAITLDGNKKSSQIISVDAGGTVSLANGTITNANASGVYINAGGTFNMTGGSITGNTATNGGGVYVDAGGTFDMSGGSIEANTATNGGGGVYVNTGATSFTMSGSAVVTEDNDVYLSEGTTISVSDDLSEDIVARITPYTYDDVDLSLLSNAPTDSSIHEKFTVTSDSIGQKYQVLSGGKLGQLM